MTSRPQDSQELVHPKDWVKTIVVNMTSGKPNNLWLSGWHGTEKLPHQARILQLIYTYRRVIKMLDTENHWYEWGRKEEMTI